MRNNRQNILREILKQLRIDANLKQFDIALILNKPQSFVSKYESGEKTLNFIEVQDICTALKIKLSDFIYKYEGKINECE